MNDGRSKPKDDDWGMTMPHLRWEEKKPADFADEFTPEIPKTPGLPPDDWGVTEPNIQIPQPQKSFPEDDWGMTQPNINLPKNQPSDFDKTAPNFNVPSSQPPASDFDKTVPNINIPREIRDRTEPHTNVAPKNNTEDWGISPPSAPLPSPDEQPNDYWSMPPPVFRVSSGETPDFVHHSKDEADKTNPHFHNPPDYDKTIPNINLPREAIEDYGKTIPNVNLRETGSFYPTEPSIQVQAPPAFEREIAPTTQFRYEQAPAKSSNMKWILLLVGLFFFFVLMISAAVGAYFLFLYKSKSAQTAPPQILKAAGAKSLKTKS